MKKVPALGAARNFATALWRPIKWTVLGLALVLVSAVGLVALVIARPELVLTDRMLIVGSHFAERFGIETGWDEGHISIESPGFLNKRVKLEFKGFRIKIASLALDARVESAKLAAAGGLLEGFTPRVTEIGPIDLRGGRVEYASVEGPQTEEQAKPQQDGREGSGELIPSFLQHAKLNPIRVEIPEWNVRGGASSILGRLDVRSEGGELEKREEKESPQNASRNAVIRLSAEAATSPGRQKALADLTLSNERGFVAFEGWKISGRAKGSLPDGTSVGAKLILTPMEATGIAARDGAKDGTKDAANSDGRATQESSPFDYAYEIDGTYGKGAAHAEIQAKGEARPDRLTTRVTGWIRNLVPVIKQVRVDGCEAQVERRGSETWPGGIHLDCAVSADVPVLPKGFPPVQLPTRAGVRLSAELQTSSFPPAGDAKFDGKVGVTLDPVLSPILTGEGKVESRLTGVPVEFPRGWKMDTDLALALKIPSFQKLVAQLRGGPLDVWAPLRPLKGSIELGVQGKFDATHGSAPVMLKTRLSSATQKLDLDANGTLTLERLQPKPRAHLAVDLALTDVKLELPPLPSPSSGKPDPMPQLMPDGRIKSEVPPPVHATQVAGVVAEEPVFTYAATVHTIEGATPIQLVSPDSKVPIPVAVKIALGNDQPPTGEVRVLGFPLSLFRRDVTMDHLTLRLASPAKDSELDGRIVFKYTDYTISILVLGTTEKPQIKFISDPPLPDDQIIAVLVFGQKLDALDPDQQRSVGSSKAAMRQGALTLFSLYYLSSMNIESIDYDPSSRTASVRYRLAEGTSLNVSQGIGSGDTSVGVRKRLSKHLAITTTLNNPSDGDVSRTVSTFLEWAYQY